MALKSLGLNHVAVGSGTENGRHTAAQDCELVFVELRLGDESAVEMLETLRKARPRFAWVVMTTNPAMASAVEAMRPGSIGDTRESLLPHRVQLTDRECQNGAEVPFSDTDSTDPQVRRTMARARIASPSDASLLIRGERGTGKRTLARAIHGWSKRADGPFISVSCASMSPKVLEAQLFGHASGALTDAASEIAAAEGGTLFLDEVGALPTELQPRLLRLFQDQKVVATGEAMNCFAGVRIMATTSQDLESAVASGVFRQDLLYRLNVIELTLPPLRHRSDLCVLADRFLADIARQTGNRFTGFTPEAREALAHHTWPGNLRELRNAIERAAILGTGPELRLGDLPEQIAQTLARPDQPIEVGRRVSLESLEDEHVRRVLASTSSLEEAAQILKINPSTLYRKRKRLGL